MMATTSRRPSFASTADEAALSSGVGSASSGATSAEGVVPLSGDVMADTLAAASEEIPLSFAPRLRRRKTGGAGQPCGSSIRPRSRRHVAVHATAAPPPPEDKQRK